MPRAVGSLEIEVCSFARTRKKIARAEARAVFRHRELTDLEIVPTRSFREGKGFFGIIGKEIIFSLMELSVGRRRRRR